MDSHDIFAHLLHVSRSNGSHFHFFATAAYISLFSVEFLTYRNSQVAVERNMY